MQQTHSDYVLQHYRWNFFTNMAQDVFCYFGFGFISFETFLPVFLSHFTDSKLLIGLVGSAVPVGWLLPQLLVAAWVERLPRKKSFVVRMALVEKLIYFFLVLLAFFAEALPSGVLIGMFMVVSLMMGLAGGVTRIGWGEMIASIFPSRRRGRYFGITYFVGGLLGALGAYVGGILLSRLIFPGNFATTFLIGTVLVMVGWTFLLWVREPVREVDAKPVSAGDYLRGLPELLRADRNFAAFILAQSLVLLGSMSFYFLAIFGREKLSFSGYQVGLLTTVFLLGRTLVAPVFGWLGDRSGHRVILMVGTACIASGFLLAMFAVNLPLMIFVGIFLVGLGRSAADVNVSPMVYALAPLARRPTYIGISSTIFGAVTFLAPLIAGVIVQISSYPVLFLVSVALELAALVFYGRFVRNHQSPQSEDG